MSARQSRIDIDEFAAQELFSVIDSAGMDLRYYSMSRTVEVVNERVLSTQATSAADYIYSMRGDDGEVRIFLQTFFRRTTSFFRNKLVWDYLRSLLRDFVDSRSIKTITGVSIGCSSGEEAYSLALLLIHELPGCTHELTGVDVDQDLIQTASTGIYPKRALESVPLSMINSYFSARGDYVQVASGVRRAIAFGTHNILTSALNSSYDVIFIRNVLYYFNDEGRAKILRHVLASARPGAIMVVSPIESRFIPRDRIDCLSDEHGVFRLFPDTTDRTSG